MESLVARGAVSVRELALPDGARVPVRVLQVRFGRATPDRLPEGALPAAYTRKPLVSVGGDAMFGELAVVRWLEKDGWEAVWVDAQARYDAGVAANGA